MSALDSPRVTSEEGILSCLWDSVFEYKELLWVISVTSLSPSPNTAINQLPYPLNQVLSIIQILQWIKCLYQDEAGSARWKTNSVTIVTVMIWFQKENISMVIVSDNKLIR